MTDTIVLNDPEAARRLMQTFRRKAQKVGQNLARRGAIAHLKPEGPGQAYCAQVLDGDYMDVWVGWDPQMGWEADCSCNELGSCEHVYAVLHELLAEHSRTIVQELSAGTTKATSSNGTNGPAESGATKRRRTEDEDLAARLAAAVGRSLDREESKFVARVKAVQESCLRSGRVSFWDVEQMGLRAHFGGWEPLEIGPSIPKGSYRFWLYVARAAQQEGATIPKFMDPVTDFREIEPELAAWERTKNVAKWNETLHGLQLRPWPAAAERGESDLRLLLDQTEIRLQIRRANRSDFETLKNNHLQNLVHELEAGRTVIPPEAAWLWEPFAQQANYRPYGAWRYSDSDTCRTLNRLLRFKQLESRIVTRSGEPLARPTEPLRWTLTPASGPEDDYRLRLTTADGQPLPPIVAVLPGAPVYYLTLEAVFAGPPVASPVLDLKKENRIPAPALEQAAGVALLTNLGMELPVRLQERVRTLSYKVAIHCALRRGYRENEEECVVRALAEAPDGRALKWAGANWLESSRPAAAQKDIITLYDSARLAEVQHLLQMLPVKGGLWTDDLTVRVTKKFPAFFAQWLASLPRDIVVHLAGELASFVTGDVAGRVKLDVTEAEIDWFDLRVVLDVADASLSPEEIQLLLKAKGEFVRLKGKGWRRLKFDLSEEEEERLARLGLSARELSAEPQRLHALQLADDSAKRFLPEQQVERIQRRAAEIKTRVAPPVPTGISAELRPYQLEGFHFLAYLSANRFGGILADDMGLGKTLQTLTWLVWLREASSVATTAPAADEQGKTSVPRVDSAAPIRPTLVVCPKSVMDNWRAESARFTPSLRTRVWSPHELDRLVEELGSADLHILNYSQLRTLGESLVPVRWLAVILDEGQYIKNPNSQTAQVARALHAEHRLVLSGTPIENRLLDLWSLMAFAMPGVLSSRAHFARIYGTKGDPFARRRLASRIRPFLVRRTKAQVAKDLPDRIEEDLFCEMEGEQKTLYTAELKRARQVLLGISTQKELAQQQFHFLVSLLRLRQICCHPQLRNPESKAPSAKLEALLEQLEPLMEEGQKVLVFSQFVELLSLLRPLLRERNWPVFYLAGETENRGELVQNFQKAEGAAVFLISLKAGGFGLNLTAASYVVLFDPWWNPAVENQAIDRTHRIGQTNKVVAYRLLIKNSIEEKIRELQKTKKALANDVLGEEKFAQSLSLDDLHFLLSDS